MQCNLGFFWHPNSFNVAPPTPIVPSQGSVGGVRRFAKPPESLERSLELSRHRGGRKRTQKRPNYKNLGEEEEDERAGGGGGGSGGSGGGGEDGWDDGSSGRGGEREKGKGTEGGGGGSSKGSRASGETAEGECVCQCRAVFRMLLFFCLFVFSPI